MKKRVKREKKKLGKMKKKKGAFLKWNTRIHLHKVIKGEKNCHKTVFLIVQNASGTQALFYNMNLSLLCLVTF